MVDLVLAGRSPEDLEKEFEPTAMSIRNWVAKAAKPAKQRPFTQVNSVPGHQIVFFKGILLISLSLKFWYEIIASRFHA